MRKLILILLGMIVLSLVPYVAGAGGTAIVTITAQPWSSGDCPTSFAFDAVSSYEVQLSWLPGGNTTATIIRGAYARWPTSPTDGFEVYTGNSSSVSHWLTTDVMILSNEGIYYRAWGLVGGNYSVCYASGSIVGGEGMTAIGSGMTIMGTAILAFLALGCMLSGYHFKNRLFMFGAIIFWLAFIGYSYLNSALSGDTFFILAGAGAMMMLLSAFFLFGGMNRDKETPESPTEEKNLNFTDWQKSRGLKTRDERRLQRGRGLYPWERQ